MKSLAIIGTGIAGMACASSLYRNRALKVYEKNSYAGGHTNTVYVDEGDRRVPIDTGFMVYNETTYPKLTALFASLGVRTKPAPMSFSVQHRPSGLEFCGSGWSGLFAQRRNLMRFGFWRLLLEIDRFNRTAPNLLKSSEKPTLGDYLRQYGFSRDFLHRYLVPMSSAVWSTSSQRMLDFPAATLIRFFKNHGFLGLHSQLSWRTVEGGSIQYRNLLLEPWKDRLLIDRAAVAVTRREGRAWVRDSSGAEMGYDQVILAAHADESLALLKDATPEEKRLLSPFQYQENVAVLHTDESVMPKTRSAWSSWNYRVEEEGGGSEAASTIYWMNRLQGVSDRNNYFVSINDAGHVDASKRLHTIRYHHPLFTSDTMTAQEELDRLNQNGVTYFCGSYFRYGFHEDALMSALQVVDRMTA